DVPAPMPLFSALLNYRHGRGATPGSSAEAQRWTGVRVLHNEERTNYPCSLSIDDLGEGFRFTAQVLSPIEPEEICDLMHTALERLVEALETAPARALCSLDVLPEMERRRLLVEWNDTAEIYPQATVMELIERQATQHPEAIAAAYEQQSLSYGELNRR